MLFITVILFILCKAILSQSEQLPYNFYNRISAIALLFCSILTLNSLHYESLGSGIAIFGGFFHVNTITQIMESFLFIIGAIILVAWPIQHVHLNKDVETNLHQVQSSRYKSTGLVENISFSIKENYLNITNYSILILFNCLGASLLISSYDFISMYLSIELQSFSLYILATLYKESELATSAGLKYFLLGGFSSCLILLGAGLVYAYTGLTDFESLYILISSYLSQSDAISNNIVGSTFFLGFIIIFVGFLFKISAAPFHNWSPDVYDDSPTIVTLWLTIIPKISILMFLLELLTGLEIQTSLIPFSIESITSQNLNDIIKNVLLLSSLLSLIIGSVVGLVQKRIKRLLAYSTISHIGFILLSLSIHSEQSIDSFLFYIIQYTITNLNIFLIIIAISYYGILQTNFNNNLKDIRYITELKNQFTYNPLIALAFSICLFSMAGIPPLIGFFSKQFVLYSSIESGHYFMSFIAILVSVISAYYYLTIIKLLYLEEEVGVSPSINSQALSDNNNKTIVVYGLNISDTNNSSSSVESTINKSTTASSLLETKNLEISSTHSFMISTLTLSILFFILKPSLILNGTQLLSLSLFNF
jgi:NADH-ubiquinone oxidoreductase chain 2